ncbi:MAG: winged helix-turn-helix transcriptional regulator [Pseudomonadota bacterium]
MAALKKTGTRVRGSSTGRPVMALLDLLGRRWTLRIVWELREAPLTFRALQEAAGGISPSVLNARIGDLYTAALIRQTDNGYALSDLGHELITKFLPLAAWSEKWASKIG